MRGKPQGDPVDTHRAHPGETYETRHPNSPPPPGEHSPLDSAGLPAWPRSLPRVEREPVVPGGFVVAGLAAGIKKSGKHDMTLVRPTGGPAAAAAVFTPNAFAAAPVQLSKRNLRASAPSGDGGYGWAEAIVGTSGSANAATGAAGLADQERIGELVTAAAGVPVDRVLHLSTGVIGTRLPLDKVEAGLARLVPALGSAPDDLDAAARGIRTTDSRTKLATTTVELPGAGPGGTAARVTVSGFAKGVGMIHPMMATMLSVVLTDAAVEPPLLHALLRSATARTWDQLSVDGDTSTNDTVFALASGASGATIAAGTPAATALGDAIEAVARDLARQQAADGEGATTLLTCRVTGAVDDADARAIARSVVASSLVKAAAHGRDPNWGRIAGAAGNARLAPAPILEAGGCSPAEAARRAGTQPALDPARLRIAIAGHLVYDGSAGGPVAFDKAAARAALETPETVIRLDLGSGDGIGEAFGCDLTEEYVIENSEYTT